MTCEDADPDSVVQAIVRGMHFTSVAGQSCGSTSRAHVHESIHDVVVDRVDDIVASIRVGLETQSVPE